MLFLPMKLWRWLEARWRSVSRWYYRNRPPPWQDIPDCHPLQNEPGEHNTTFVSRHAIAECGLKCDNFKCGKLAAPRGDFRSVRMTHLGEAVICPVCGWILVAAPDTEHGDDLLPYNDNVFHRFVRIAPAKALREEWGEDMTFDHKGRMQASRTSLKDIGKENHDGSLHLQRSEAQGDA